VRFARIRIFLLSTFALIVASCGGSPTEPAGDKIVEGVKLTELFAPPTDAEIQTESSRWDTRNVSAQGVVEVASAQETFDGAPATVRIVSHDVDGVRHYGAIASPDNAANGSLPILMYLHGGDDGENINTVENILSYAFSGKFSGGVPDDFVYVVPSFRSEKLQYDGTTYQSEGDPSPWDLDVDDALALLNVAIATTPAADSTRIGLVGFSRGACVAMLMAIRDARIDLVVEFFGPTDFFGEFVEKITEDALQGHLRDLPGLDYLNEEFIQPLKNGTMRIPEVRSQMLRRSPVYFASRLPMLQVHHGTADSTVWVSQAERLVDVMTEIGRSAPNFEYYYYPGAGHNPYEMNGSIDRGVTFIERLLNPVMALGATCAMDPADVTARAH